MVEELLIALFVQHEGRRLDSVQWLREAVLEAKLHETATAQATRAAFVEFLDRLDPAELEARFERAARRARRAPRTRRSTGTCSRASIAISSRCRRSICRTRLSRRSPRPTVRC